MSSGTRKYGEYITEIDGKKYAVVRIPTGNGKYKKKVKLLSLIGGTKRDAQKWAWGELEKEKGEEVRTFQSLADWYREEYLVAPVYQKGKRLYGLRTWKAQRTLLERLCIYFGLYHLDHITIDVLRRYKRERLASVGIVSVNREFALMRTMFHKAKARKWIVESPFELGELIEVSLESKRRTELDTRIAVRLLARSRKSEQRLLFPLIYVLMETGARPSEIYPFKSLDDDVPREPLTWGRITQHDFKAITVVSYKGRIREERLNPISGKLGKVLRDLHAELSPDPDDLVFPVKCFKRSWRTLCKSVRVEGIWMRDFRHYRNHQLMLDPRVNDVERMLWMGHKQLPTNARYGKLDKSFIEKFTSPAS